MTAVACLDADGHQIARALHKDKKYHAWAELFTLVTGLAISVKDFHDFTI